MKHCAACDSDKPLDQFSLDKNRKDGHYPICRSCKRKQNSVYESSDRAKEVRRAGERVKSQRRLRDCPEKLRARSALRYAVKTGRVIKGVCYACGSAETEGHHPDYSKPLDVVWTCRPHHADLHRGSVSGALPIQGDQEASL